MGYGIQIGRKAFTLAVVILAALISRISAQTISITPEVYVSQFTLIDHIVKTQRPSNDYSAKSINEPQFRLSVRRETKGNYDYGVSASLLTYSKLISFDFFNPNNIQVLVKNTYSNVLTQKMLGLDANISRRFNKWRLTTSLGILNEMDFKGRVDHTKIYEYFAAYTIRVSSEEETTYRLGAMGLKIPKSGGGFDQFYATFSTEYALTDRLNLSALFVFQRRPRSLLSFKTFEEREWTVYPEVGGIVIDEDNQSGHVYIAQDKLNVSIGLSYDLDLIKRKEFRGID